MCDAAKAYHIKIVSDVADNGPSHTPTENAEMRFTDAQVNTSCKITPSRKGWTPTTASTTAKLN